MLFAGIRFCLSGLIILTIGRLTNRSFSLNDAYRGKRFSSLLFLLLFALLNTTLHYAAFYIGLSHSQGSRASILNSLSVFTVVILACVFFKSDRMTLRKVVGCVVGFLGILALNLGGEDSGSFTFLGDGMGDGELAEGQVEMVVCVIRYRGCLLTFGIGGDFRLCRQGPYPIQFAGIVAGVRYSILFA